MGEFDNYSEFYIPEKPKEKARAGIMEYLPSVLLTIVLVFVSGLGTLVQFEMSFKNIVFGTFLVSLALRLVTVFSAKYVGSNLCYNKKIYSDEFTEIKNEFLELGKGIDKAHLDKYVACHNRELKKQMYIKKQKTKIEKHLDVIHKCEFKNSLSYSKRRERQIKKRNRKIEWLEKISKPEYVEENIPYLKVKYNKVRTCYFFSPLEDNVTKSRNYTVNVSKELSKEILKSLPLTIFLSSLGSMLLFGATTGKINAISLSYDLAVIIFNFSLGWFVVGKKAVSTTINAFLNRIIFLKEYRSKNEKQI